MTDVVSLPEGAWIVYGVIYTGHPELNTSNGHLVGTTYVPTDPKDPYQGEEVKLYFTAGTFYELPTHSADVPPPDGGIFDAWSQFTFDMGRNQARALSRADAARARIRSAGRL